MSIEIERRDELNYLQLMLLNKEATRTPCICHLFRGVAL